MTRYNDKIYSAPTILTCIGVALILIAIIAFSWAVTVGIVYLIFLCFGWTFNLLIATGIWLVLCLLGSFFGTGVNVNNNK